MRKLPEEERQRRVKERNKLYHADNKVSISIQKKEYYRLNKNKIRNYINSDSEKQRRRIYMHRYWLKHRFGITPEVYEKMWNLQNGRCGICKNPESMTNTEGEVRMLCVDHCHKTQEIGQLLCSKCNSILGFCDDDISILQSAIKYLKKHRR